MKIAQKKMLFGKSVQQRHAAIRLVLPLMSCIAPLMSLLPLKPPYHASEVGREVEAVGVAGRVARRDRARSAPAGGTKVLCL